MKEKNKSGRPTDYNEDYNDKVYKLCLLGLTDAQIAPLFNVTETTLNNWKIKNPLFFESIQKGKEIADAEIAHSLYQRAKGYSHPDTDIRVLNGEIEQTEITKHYPPDTAAAFIWLKNRQGDKWRDKPEDASKENIKDASKKVIYTVAE